MAENDPHWNAAGMEAVARLLYGLIRRNGLLAGVELAPWPEAEAAVEEIHARGLAEARELPPVERRLGGWKLDGRVEFGPLTPEDASQISGGIDREGLVAPYAALTLRCRGAGALELRGQALERPEIDGARVRVFVDEHELGALELRAGADLAARFELPPDVAARDYLSARFEADDYAYVGPRLQRCAAFRLASVALVP